MQPSGRTVFVSHSSLDDPFVRRLQQALSDLRWLAWIDSRELRGGLALETTLFEAIAACDACIVVISRASMSSEWVMKEARQALAERARRGPQGFQVVPILLDQADPAPFEALMGAEPIYVIARSEAGGLAEALPALLAALRLELPADRPRAPAPTPDEVIDWRLELSNPDFVVKDDEARASARVCLLRAEVGSMANTPEAVDQGWLFEAPLGAASFEDIRWYLQDYPAWPSPAFATRAAAIEQSFRHWGEAVWQAAIGGAPMAQRAVLADDIEAPSAWRLSVCLPPPSSASHPAAALALAALPWELIRPGDCHLNELAMPVRVRRVVPGRAERTTVALEPPVRILLVSPRPEFPSHPWLDHRSASLPLVEAMESLGEVMELDMLAPPTFPALAGALARAQSEQRPYHVVHLDGLGDAPQAGAAGSIAFEEPADAGKAEARRAVLVDVDRVGSLLREHRVPLVFLQLRGAGRSGSAWESTACRLVSSGVGSVVAMQPSSVDGTARRLVEVFYQRLSEGASVGSSVAAAQRAMFDEPFRPQIPGAGRPSLQDWFVPVLFQSQADLRLFARPPSRGARDVVRRMLLARLGGLPAGPVTGFVGRSRELLALERRLFDGETPHVIVVGNAGEGKTALAIELARWLVRSGRVDRAAFVSLEEHDSAAALLNALAAQLVKPAVPVTATPRHLEPALMEIERALLERPTLLLIDNLETLMPDDPAAASEQLAEVLAVCGRLNAAGSTRVVFTTRMAPDRRQGEYPHALSTLSVGRLAHNEARQLLERMREYPVGPADAEHDAAERLLQATQCHARTLCSLSEPLRRGRRMDELADALDELMTELHRRFPGHRENSLFASVELSLRRLDPAARKSLRFLATFRGPVDLAALARLMGAPIDEARFLGEELCRVGLAAALAAERLRLDPALTPFLRSSTSADELAALSLRWIDDVRRSAESLYDRHLAEPGQVHVIVSWELPNFLEALEQLDHDEGLPAAVVIRYCTRLQTLADFLNRPHVNARIQAALARAQARSDTAWTHEQFEAMYLRVHAGFQSENPADAEPLARQLHEIAFRHGEQAYPLADVDLACAALTWGEALRFAGRIEESLPCLADAERRAMRIEQLRPGQGAEALVNTLLIRGNALESLGRAAGAAADFDAAVLRAEAGGFESMTAAAKLGLARQWFRMNPADMIRERLPPTPRSPECGPGDFDAWAEDREKVRIEAATEQFHRERMQLLFDARDIYARLNHSNGLAQAWSAIGAGHAATGELGPAEQAYRQALVTAVNGRHRTEAILIELGNLCLRQERWNEALAHCEQAARETQMSVNMGAVLSNMALAHLRLGHLDPARDCALRALEAMAPLGLAGHPWNAWTVLEQVETENGQAAKAREARRKAVDALLAHRKQGGENPTESARICQEVLARIQRGQVDAAVMMVFWLRSLPQWQAAGLPLLDVLDAILGGRRDPALADHPKLSCFQACEVLLLLDNLSQESSPVLSPAAPSKGEPWLGRWRPWRRKG